MAKVDIERIKTKEDWWKVVDACWADFIECGQYVGMKLPDDIATAKTNRKWEPIYQWLQGIWFEAPDSPSIHRWPSWGQLCDCCSEVWVFEETEQLAHVNGGNS